MAIMARHVQVTGRVQGVSFRAYTQAQAEARDVSGWVRNLPDGSVEAVVAGSEAAVEALIAAMRAGPPMAQVSDVRVATAEPPQEHGFRIIG